MKYLLNLLFTTFFITSYGQFSISTGGQWINENLFGSGDYDNALFQTRPFHYPGATLQGDFVKNRFRIFSEIGTIRAKYVFKRNSWYTSGGGSSPYYSDSRTYSSNIVMNYFTIKFGTGSYFEKQLDENSWISFSYNFYGEVDYLTEGSESGQVMTRTTTSNNNVNQTFETTEYPVSYTPFRQVHINPVILHLGADIKARFGYKNYFCEVMFALGAMNKYRMEVFKPYGMKGVVYPDYRQESPWYFVSGLKLGYVFRKNKNK